MIDHRILELFIPNPFWQQLLLLNIFHLKILHEDVETGLKNSYHPELCAQGPRGVGRKVGGKDLRL